MLIQLPNGDWVNPEGITYLHVDEFCPVLEVRATTGVCAECSTGTLEAAKELRDQLAEQINKALYEGKK